MKYDVIIIGAGPAGLNCAKILGDNGKKVLLLEKNNVIGTKVCAGALTGKDLKYLNLPEAILDGKFNTITFHAGKTKYGFHLDYDFIYTIDRKKLGNWQFEQLNRKNVDVKTGVNILEIGQDFIIYDSEKIYFSYLVGADGSGSIARKHLNLPIEKLDVAIQYIIPTNQYNNMEVFYNSKLFHSWYSWIFPHNGYTSIGCGVNPKYVDSTKLQQNFHQWLEENKINIADAKYEAFFINYDFKGYKFNNIFLIGDAAGLASGFTGEGIYQALISGEEIARLIIDKNYVPEKLNQIIAKNKTHEKILSLLIHLGPFRDLTYKFIGFFLSKKYFAQKAVSVLT